MEGAALYATAAVGIWFVPAPQDITWITPVIFAISVVGFFACVAHD